MQEINNSQINEPASIFKRLIARFHRSKLAQKLTGLIVTSSLLLTLASCDQNQFNTDNVNDNPNDNTSNVGNNNNNTNNNQNNGNGNNQDDDYSQHSQLLQNILNNEYYDDLLFRTEKKGEYELYETGDFKPHPYAFLEQQGHDVEAIKNGEIDAYTMSYVLDEEPNNLYMYTRVADETNTYYTNYLLKYELTDQEMDDYQLMQGGEGQTTFYLQAVFINNEISKTREPEIIDNSKILIDTFNEMAESMDQRYKGCELIFLNPVIKTKTIDLQLTPKITDTSKIHIDGEITNLVCWLDGMQVVDGIYKQPSYYGPITAISTEKKPAHFYLTQEGNLRHIYCHDFETKPY